jgi:glycosyltransferase involved in cell wall biosynthesis
MQRPRAAVAVVIPTYNAASLVSGALESVHTQTYTDRITIVADDGSSDVADLRKALQPYLSSLVFLALPHQGAAAARNHATRAVESEFVAFLDADDEWLPEFLEHQVTYLKTHPDFEMVYSDGYLFGPTEDGARRYSDQSPSRGVVSFESLVRGTCNVLTSSVVARRRSIEAVGGFDEGLPRAHDFDLWIRLVRHGAHIAYNRTPLVRYRVHTSGISGDTQRVLERDVTILRHLKEVLELSEAERKILRRAVRRAESSLALDMAKKSLKKGDAAELRRALLTAVRLRFAPKTALALLMAFVAPALLGAGLTRMEQLRDRSAKRHAKIAGEDRP